MKEEMNLDTIKILISDDSILLRKKLKDFLVSMGCNQDNIIEVSNGQVAIDTYKEYNPDLVFLDIVMPVKDGISAVTEIVEYDSSARVIIASSVGTQSNVTKALKAGAIDFIQKPIDNNQVEKIVLNTIGGNN